MSLVRLLATSRSPASRPKILSAVRFPLERYTDKRAWASVVVFLGARVPFGGVKYLRRSWTEADPVGDRALEAILRRRGSGGGLVFGDVGANDVEKTPLVLKGLIECVEMVGDVLQLVGCLAEGAGVAGDVPQLA